MQSVYKLGFSMVLTVQGREVWTADWASVYQLQIATGMIIPASVEP